MIVERAVELSALGEWNHLARFTGVKIAQVVELADVILALAGDGGGCDRQQLIRGLAHGGDHHDGMLPDARFHDGSDAADGGGGFDGGSAKLHDDHQSSNPSEYISSALRTAAPAAPRTVLCPRATNL